MTFMTRIVLNMRPGSQKVRSDLNALKAEVEMIDHELIPWGTEELALLSSDLVEQKIKRGFGTSAKGTFMSIYQEPMIAYAYKGYLSGAKNGIIYAKTANREFVFRITRKGVEIQVNGKWIGLFASNNVLYDKNHKKIAALQYNKQKMLNPIHIGNKEVASLVNPKLSQRSSTRAFDMLQKLDSEEEDILLALSVLQLVRTNVEL